MYKMGSCPIRCKIILKNQIIVIIIILIYQHYCPQIIGYWEDSTSYWGLNVSSLHQPLHQFNLENCDDKCSQSERIQDLWQLSRHVTSNSLIKCGSGLWTAASSFHICSKDRLMLLIFAMMSVRMHDRGPWCQLLLLMLPPALSSFF